MKRDLLAMRRALCLLGLVMPFGIAWTFFSSASCDHGVLQERLDCLEDAYLRGSAPEAFRALLIYGDLLEAEGEGSLEEAERLDRLLLTYCRAQAVAAEMGDENERFLAYRQARYWYLRKMQEDGLSDREVADRVRGFNESSCKDSVLIHDDKLRQPSTMMSSGTASAIAGNAAERGRLGLRRSLGERTLEKTILERFEAYLDEYLEGNTAKARRAMIQARDLLTLDAEGVFGENFRLESLQDVYSRLYCIAVAEGNADEAFLSCEQAKYWWLKASLLNVQISRDGVVECYRTGDISSVAANGRRLFSADAICRASLVFDVKSRGGRLPAYAVAVRELKAPEKGELRGAEQ